MAFQRPTSPGDDDGFPSLQLPQSGHGAPSVISSRMSDTGDEPRPTSGATTGTSTKRGESPTSKSRDRLQTGTNAGSTNKRGSLLSTNDGSTRTRNISSRSSHVPSITSNAFFRPMSSQQLQAHRAMGARPPTMSQPPQPDLDIDDGATDVDGSVVGRSTSPNHVIGIQRITSNDEQTRPPPSRGTENTDSHDRITANTSPTQGHYPTGSMSDSVRPLHRTADTIPHTLSINVDKSYRDIGRSVPSPVKSPRSFRSSFLLAGRSNSNHGRNRSTEGAEKLSSCASTPKHAHPHGDAQPQPEPQQPPDHASPLPKSRTHQFFEGNTVFCLGGRWQNTKGKPVNIATGLFILVPVVLFFAFEASWLWNNISPALPLLFAYVAFVCISSFFHASVSDPGILPRNLHLFPTPDENDDPLRLGPPTNDWALVKSAESRTAAMEVPVKHCKTCNIWRPPRAHHCRLCDNCIEGHDHHCVWLNNCVGKRNYRFFFAFVTSGTILSIYLVALSLVQLLVYRQRQGVSFGRAINHFPVPFALVILGILTFSYPAALMGYHIFLMARGETTREYINAQKFNKKDRFRAFSQGSVWKNFAAVLCRPRQPTYYQFKSKHSHGDQRLGEVRRDMRPKEHPQQGLEMQDVPQTGETGFQGPVALRSDTTH